MRQRLFHQIASVPFVAANVFGPLLAVIDLHEVKLTSLQAFQAYRIVLVKLHHDLIEVILADINVQFSSPVIGIALVAHRLPKLEVFNDIWPGSQGCSVKILVKIFPPVKVLWQDGELPGNNRQFLIAPCKTQPHGQAVECFHSGDIAVVGAKGRNGLL